MLVYAITVPADSGALTSGMTMAADPELPRRDHGRAFDRRLQPVGARRLGAWRRAGCGRWTARAPPPGWRPLRCWRQASCLAPWRSIGPEARYVSHEPPPPSHHPRARHDADAGLGVELLSAGDPRRSDRARSRRFLELDLRRLLGVAGALGLARPAHRPADRPGRRPVGAVDVQSGAGGGPGAARLQRPRSRCWCSPGCCSASAWAPASTMRRSPRSGASMAMRRGARSPASR